MIQSKVFLDPLLVGCWRRYFYATNFFRLPLKTSFMEEIPGVLLDMLYLEYSPFFPPLMK
jgi:hypothetical protein